MLCNFTIHFTKNYLTWANLHTRAIRFELLNQTHFLTIYFVNTIHVNSETLGLLFMANHQHRFHFVNQNFIAISGLIHITIQFVSQITTQTPKTAHKTITDCTIGFHKFLTLRFQDLGPIKRPFKASTQPKHQQSS